MKLSKKYLEEILTKHHKELEIDTIKQEEIETSSTIFKVSRVDIDYHNGEGKGTIQLTLHEYKGGETPTDWSGQIEERRDVVRHSAAMLRYFERIFPEESPAPSIYDSKDDILITEFLGKETLESKFLRDGPNEDDLKRLMVLIATKLHGKWEDNYQKSAFLSRLRQQNPIKNIKNYLTGICMFNGFKTTDEELSGIFEGIREPIDGLKDVSGFLNGVIHSDLHLGHVLIHSGEFRIIDYGSASIGPKTFDLVDILKHPLSIDPEKYPNQESQMALIERMLERYLLTHITHVVGSGLGVPKRGFQKWEELLRIFYFSNIYRSMRAAAKSYWLERNNREKYNLLVKKNQLYPEYRRWYLADAAAVTSYLINNPDSYRLQDPGKLERVLEIAKTHIPDMGENPIELSRMIHKERKRLAREKAFSI